MSSSSTEMAEKGNGGIEETASQPGLLRRAALPAGAAAGGAMLFKLGTFTYGKLRKKKPEGKPLNLEAHKELLTTLRDDHMLVLNGIKENSRSIIQLTKTQDEHDQRLRELEDRVVLTGNPKGVATSRIKRRVAERTAENPETS